MKVVVKKVHAVCSWSWHIPRDGTHQHEAADTEEDVCGICRVSYNGTCPSCKYPGDECPLVMGECNHNFHVHCIVQWLDTATSRGLCPMCRQLFSLKRGVAINDSQLDHFAKLLNKVNRAGATELANAGLAEEQDLMMEQDFLVR